MKSSYQASGCRSTKYLKKCQRRKNDEARPEMITYTIQTLPPKNNSSYECLENTHRMVSPIQNEPAPLRQIKARQLHSENADDTHHARRQDTDAQLRMFSFPAFDSCSFFFSAFFCSSLALAAAALSGGRSLFARESSMVDTLLDAMLPFCDRALSES